MNALRVVKGAAFRGVVQLQICEQVIHDFAVVEAHFCQLTAADGDHLVDVPRAAGVIVVDARVVGVAGLGARNCLHAAQGGLMPVRTHPHMFITYAGKAPKVHPSAFIAPTAVLIGDVEVGAESSIWFGTVIRADNGPIRIGARTSIQDNAVVHVSEHGKTIIGDDVTVGHAAVMEDCNVGNHALIGTNATILNGATIGERALIAAGSVVVENAAIPASVVAAGAPAKVKKPLEGEAAKWIEIAADEYVKLSRSYLSENIGLRE